jgi:putative ABC transport system substrate-binding protein
VLKELLPAVRRIGVLESSVNPYYRAARGQFEQTCRLHGFEVVYAEIAAAREVDGAIAQLAQQRAQALLLRSDPIVFDNRFEIAHAALKHRLPTMAVQQEIVREGGALVSYSPTVAEGVRRSASQIARILRGARPADVPVEQPTRFELVINLRTARALALTIPQSVLLRADEVIR